jgi:hypothetical protein
MHNLQPYDTVLLIFWKIPVSRKEHFSLTDFRGHFLYPQGHNHPHIRCPIIHVQSQLRNPIILKLILSLSSKIILLGLLNDILLHQG